MTLNDRIEWLRPFTIPGTSHVRGVAERLDDARRALGWEDEDAARYHIERAMMLVVGACLARTTKEDAR